MKKLSEQIKAYLDDNGIGQKEIFYKPIDSTNQYYTCVMVDREKQSPKTTQEIAKDIVNILINQR